MNARNATLSTQSGKLVPKPAISFPQVRQDLVSACGNEMIAAGISEIMEFEKPERNGPLVTSFRFDNGEVASFSWPNRLTYESFLASDEFTARPEIAGAMSGSARN